MKKSLLSVFLACLLLAAPVSCARDDRETPAAPVYTSYKDIPGVTAADIAAVEALKQRRDAFAVAMNYSTEAFYREDGSIGGYSRLFCEWLTELFGVPFEPVIVSWDRLLDGLSSHEIDFTGELTATPERRPMYIMTDAIAERSIKQFRMTGAEKLSTLAEERLLRYAFLEGSTAYNYVLEASEHPFTVTEVADHDEAYALLYSGAVDAFFEDSTAEATLDRYGGVTATDFFPLIYTPVSLSTRNPELAPIIAVVQNALENGALLHLTELYNQGDHAYQQYKFFSRLTSQEKNYLRTHGGGRGIPIAAEYDNYPASFYNTTEKRWQGIAHDVLAHISDLTGLSFDIVNESTVMWPDLLEALTTGKVALITELIPSAERQGQYLWPDDPYTVDNFALISRVEQDNIRVNQILHSTVAVPRGTAYEEIFDKWFPGHQQLRRYGSTEDCFMALDRGEVDFVMASRNQMLSMTNYEEKPWFKVNILFPNTYSSAFGLNKNEKTLRSIISKAQKLVDVDRISDDWTHRVFDYRAKLARTQLPYLVGLAALLLVVMALLLEILRRNRKSGRELERLVKLRTAELEVQTEAARQASRAKGEFLSRMSHEIRTPLNAIIGMAQIARQVAGLPAKALGAISEIITASNHLLGVLNDVLDMAKIESGKFVLVEEPFALLPAMNEVTGIIEQRCREKHIDFATDLERLAGIGVIGDKLRLKQVLINLLGNAVKFTESGGSIRFAVIPAEESDKAVHLRFSVEDSGIGMSDDQMARLFTAFEQADSTVAVKFGGTGLGLAISQNMVQSMGGLITAQSRIGHGAAFRFEITLPKVALADENHRDDGPLHLQGRRILLVEDVEVNRLILVELLRDTGAHIEEATDGVQALEEFSRAEPGHYDLILMDVQMPRMDGYETTRAIRNLPREDARSVPIIAMTANAYKEDIEKALDSGMNGHVAKPLDLGIVREMLRKYLK